MFWNVIVYSTCTEGYEKRNRSYVFILKRKPTMSWTIQFKIVTIKSSSYLIGKFFDVCKNVNCILTNEYVIVTILMLQKCWNCFICHEYKYKCICVKSLSIKVICWYKNMSTSLHARWRNQILQFFTFIFFILYKY